MASLRLRLMRDYVLVLPGPVDTHVGRIEIPEHLRMKANKGAVVALGDGRQRLRDGTWVPFEFKHGDIVFFRRYGATELQVGSTLYYLLHADEICGVWDEDEQGVNGPVDTAV